MRVEEEAEDTGSKPRSRRASASPGPGANRGRGESCSGMVLLDPNSLGGKRGSRWRWRVRGRDGATASGEGRKPRAMGETKRWEQISRGLVVDIDGQKARGP
jgi:hypothetical protein